MRRSWWNPHVLRTWVGKIIPASRKGVQYQVRILDVEIHDLYAILTYEWLSWFGTDEEWHACAPGEKTPNPLVVFSEWQLFRPMSQEAISFRNIADGNA